MTERDDQWLTRAIALATANVADGGGPFGAVVVRGDRLVAEGQNRVTAANDPTAHAEVTAIRRACADLGTFTLAGHTLYASCEPCPMCLASALWARVDRIVYAADRDDAARVGFDDREFHELLARPRDTWERPVEQRRLAAATEPFDAWRANAERTDY